MLPYDGIGMQTDRQKYNRYLVARMSAISVRNLFKSFGDSIAVNGISFEVPEGSFFAFLGPNGAGKSTTISIICSLLKRDSGEVSVFGRDSSDPESRSAIGVVFQNPMLDSRLTVRENIRMRGSMYGMSSDGLEHAVESAIAQADATEFADRPYGTLSGGQRRRADIARALVHGPKLLILDEPTTGLDPRTRRNIWKTIVGLNRRNGLTVFLTTHYMEEASVADEIVIINKGDIVATGTPASLKERYCSDSMVVHPISVDDTKRKLDSMGLSYTSKNDIISIPVRSTMDTIPIITELEPLMTSFEVRSGTLDDAFIAITGDDSE